MMYSVLLLYIKNVSLCILNHGLKFSQNTQTFDPNEIKQNIYLTNIL